MKPIFALFVVLAFLPTCKTSSPVVNTVATTAIDCTKPLVQKIALDTISDGELSLVRDDWKSGLSTLVTKYGIEVVACVVGHIFNQSTSDLRSSTDPNTATKSSRAKIWLDENRIVFTKDSPVN